MQDAHLFESDPFTLKVVLDLSFIDLSLGVVMFQMGGSALQAQPTPFLQGVLASYLLKGNFGLTIGFCSVKFFLELRFLQKCGGIVFGVIVKCVFNNAGDMVLADIEQAGNSSFAQKRGLLNRKVVRVPEVQDEYETSVSERLFLIHNNFLHKLNLTFNDWDLKIIDSNMIRLPFFYNIYRL